MGEPLRIRRYEPSDSGTVREVMEVALRDVDAYVEDAPALQDDDIVAEYIESGGDFLVGEVDGRVAATGAFRPPGGPAAERLGVTEETAEVKRMHVLPGYQRRGYGQRIYDELEARAREKAFSEFVLGTTSRQRAAHAFYESNGFTRVERVPIEEYEAAFDVLLYRKDLE